MENIKIDAGQARTTLTQLRDMIQTRRQKLLNGHPPNGIANELQVWDNMLKQLQAELLLEKSAQINMLYEVSYTINASLDWRRTLQAVMDAVIRITEAERGMLMGIDEDGELKVELTSSATSEKFTEADLRFSYSIVTQALQRGRPILTTNAQIDPRFRQSDSIVAYGMRSILCAPLLYQEETLGVIYLDNRARAGVFTQEDLAMLSAFANQASVALANAREHRKTDQALTERVRELTILQEMARDLNTSLRFDRVMERSVSWAVAAASAEAGAIALVAEEGLRWMAKVGDVQPDTAFALRTIYSRKPIAQRDRLAIPLLRDDRPIGVLYLVAQRHGVRPGKLEFVARVADNAAIAVENARLYEALRQANQAKSEFVSIVSHELRTPMTSIQGYADMLAQGMAGELTSQQRDFLAAIHRNTQRMRILVSDLLDISRIETGRLKLEMKPTSMVGAVEEAVHTVRELLEEKSQRLALDIWDNLPQAMADPNRLTQILINLLSNAIKYTPDGGRIEVKVGLHDSEPDVIRCAIADTGIGISPEDQTRLFTKFFRADNPDVREQPGTGLGLAITKSLVEMQGGRIWLRSAPGQGSTFSFTIPLALPEQETSRLREPASHS
jgi:signal transduction histidine kinase